MGHGLKRQRALPGNRDLQRDTAMAQQVELVRRFAFVEQVLARFEAHVLRAAADELSEAFLETNEEGVLPDDSFESFDGYAPRLGSVARMASTSSVMSMPTGHQVIQRPQPTQPDVSN